MDRNILQVLLVENELVIRMDLAATIEAMGHRVTEAGSGDHALELLTGETSFDLLVTDIDMPGAVNGLALAFEMCRSLPDCHILIISGGRHPGPDEMPEGCRFLAKPLAESDLANAIEGLRSGSGMGAAEEALGS